MIFPCPSAPRVLTPAVCYSGGRARPDPAPLRRHRPRPHARVGRPLLYSAARRRGRARDQSGAPRRGRRDAPRLPPARRRPRRPEHVLRPRERRQAERGDRPRPSRGARGRARSCPDGGRRRRELPARRRAEARLRLPRAGRRPARPRLLLDLGVRADRPALRPAGLRPHHQRGLRRHAPRTGGGAGPPRRLPADGRRAGGRARLRRDRGGAPPSRPHRAGRTPRRLDAGVADRGGGHLLRQRAERRPRIPGPPGRHGGPRHRRPAPRDADRGRAAALAAPGRGARATRARTGPTLRDAARTPGKLAGPPRSSASGSTGSRRSRRPSTPCGPRASRGRRC